MTQLEFNDRMRGRRFSDRMYNILFDHLVTEVPAPILAEYHGVTTAAIYRAKKRFLKPGEMK